MKVAAIKFTEDDGSLTFQPVSILYSVEIYNQACAELAMHEAAGKDMAGLSAGLACLELTKLYVRSD